MAAATSDEPSLESLRLQGRVAIVAGASRGIALRLASLGAKVVINYNSSSVRAVVVAKKINSACNVKCTPRAVTFFMDDVSDESQVKAPFEIAETRVLTLRFMRWSIQRGLRTISFLLYS